jgi:hypothetical protein
MSDTQTTPAKRGNMFERGEAASAPFDPQRTKIAEDAPQPAAAVVNLPTTKAIESSTEEIAPGVFRHTWILTIDTNQEPDPQA